MRAALQQPGNEENRHHDRYEATENSEAVGGHGVSLSIFLFTPKTG
jgi:hypothetical protein